MGPPARHNERTGAFQMDTREVQRCMNETGLYTNRNEEPVSVEVRPTSEGIALD